MITIIVPIYNAEEYIEKCICSVMQQTYQGVMECILVNDCSSDLSIEIAEDLIKNYAGNIRFRIIRHDQNKGVSAARNTGIENATGDWLFFLDSDDYLTPNCIDLLVSKSKEYPYAQIVQGGAITDRGNPVHIDMEGSSSKIVDYMDDPIIIKKGILLNNICYASGNVWNKLIKKSFVLEHNLFFKEGIIYEDAHWQFFVAKHLKAVTFVRKYTYVYTTIRENSIMRANSYFSAKSQDSWITLAEDFYANLDGVCKREQVSRIMDVAFPLFIHSKDEEKIAKSRQIIIRTARKCSYPKRMRIYLVLIISRILMKKARIYRFFVFKFI